MNKVVCLICLTVFAFSTAQASDYEVAVDGWKSHKDVAEWMRNEWRFDLGVARDMSQKISREGPSAETIKSSEETFNEPSGWCKDAANFAKDTLNTIDPKYKAGYIFIKNRLGPPNHWVTGFRYKDKLYVMDYGAGSEWREMMGLHGPYDSIDEYGEFLSTVDARNFELDFVAWKRSNEKGGGNPIRAKIVLGKFDRNSDHRISYKEAPKPMKDNFKRLDTDVDGYLNESELRFLPPR